jgi:hypothetical protein
MSKVYASAITYRSVTETPGPRLWHPQRVERNGANAPSPRPVPETSNVGDEGAACKLIWIDDYINIARTLQPQQHYSSIYKSFDFLLMTAPPRHLEHPFSQVHLATRARSQTNWLHTESHVQLQLPREIRADPHRSNPSPQLIVL